mmetsp:Transcript_83151/g.238926  ORF Transcript_83151/g.238926 Transcript_83151/m.238926 type:complete len:280 (+) Transcript_83151:2-841(+)
MSGRPRPVDSENEIQRPPRAQQARGLLDGGRVAVARCRLGRHLQQLRLAAGAREPCADGPPGQPYEDRPLDSEMPLRKVWHAPGQAEGRQRGARLRAQGGAVEGEPVVDEGPVVVLVAVSIVDVHMAASLLAIGDNGIGIGRHGTRTPPPPHPLEEDGAASHEDGHVAGVQRHTDGVPAGARRGLVVPEIEPLPGRQVHFDALGFGVYLGDRSDQDRLADQEVVVGVFVCLLVVQVVVPQRPQYRRASARPLREDCVPRRQHLVANADLLANHRRSLIA